MGCKSITGTTPNIFLNGSTVPTNTLGEIMWNKVYFSSKQQRSKRDKLKQWPGARLRLSNRIFKVQVYSSSGVVLCSQVTYFLYFVYRWLALCLRSALWTSSAGSWRRRMIIRNKKIFAVWKARRRTIIVSVFYVDRHLGAQQKCEN